MMAAILFKTAALSATVVCLFHIIFRLSYAISLQSFMPFATGPFPFPFS